MPTPRTLRDTIGSSPAAVITAAVWMVVAVAVVSGEPWSLAEPAPGNTARRDAPAGVPGPLIRAANCQALATSLLGAPEDIALASISATIYPTQVVERDGVALDHVVDYSPTRINLTITDGIVTAATLG